MEGHCLKKLVSILLALILALGVATAFAEPADVTTYTRVKTTNGTLQGYTYRGVNTFLGIQYATAERFQMPVPVEPWPDDEVKLAMYYGEVCPAGKSTTSAAEFITPSGVDNVENEETCLNLNVWSPTMDEGASLPVIFWIHGGGYSSGSSIELAYYEGHNLAATGEVVFVSVNHRLNYLGFTDLSAYGEEYKYSGNAGMADIVCALEWVRDNISRFGGDPENVTIIGQSGGGGKVMALLGMPAAHGLFDKAVVMSGGVGGLDQATAQEQAAALVEAAGSVEALVEMPYDELAALAASVGVSSSPVVDGDYYPARTIEDGVFSEISKDVPVMIGTALTEIAGNNIKNIARGQRFPADGDLTPYALPEMTEEKFQELAAAKFGDNAEAAIAAFEEAYPELDPRHCLFAVARDSDKEAAKAEQGGAPVYSYIFSYEFPIFGGCAAWHTGGDIPFFFRNVDDVDYMIVGDEEGAYNLQDAASRALINFATTGDPSSEELPWEAFTAENGATMVFDATPSVGYHHDAAFQAILAGE